MRIGEKAQEIHDASYHFSARTQHNSKLGIPCFRYLQDFASSTVDGFKKMNETEHVQEAGWNPLAIFRIIIRVAHFFKHMRQQSNGFPDLPLNVLQKHGSAGGIPLKNDLADAARGILRIHFMYDLNVSDVRNVCSHSLRSLRPT